MDLLIDKQELIRNKVLKANDLCGSDTTDVSVRHQFEGKIFGLRKISEPFKSMATLSASPYVPLDISGSIGRVSEQAASQCFERHILAAWGHSEYD